VKGRDHSLIKLNGLGKASLQFPLPRASYGTKRLQDHGCSVCCPVTVALRFTRLKAVQIAVFVLVMKNILE